MPEPGSQPAGYSLPDRNVATGMEYYELPYNFSGKQRFLVYFTNDHDGVATDEAGRILSFASPAAIQEFCKMKKWKVQAPNLRLDLDQVGQWLKTVDGDNLDCVNLYHTWNLLGDIATSLGKADDFPGYDEDHMAIHEELFWGCNLPGMAPPDRPYRARLSEEEVESLQHVLRTGVELFLKNIKEL